MSEPPTGWSAPVGGWASPGAEQPPPAATVTPPPGSGPPQAWYGAPQTGYGGLPPGPGVVPLRPLGLGELLDGAIKIIRRYPRPTLGLSAAIAVVVTLINVIFALLLDAASPATTDRGSTDVFVVSSTAIGTTLPGAVVGFLANLVLTGALVVVVGKAVLGQPAPTSEVWATVRPRLLPLLGLSVLIGLAVMVPSVVGIALAVALGVGIGAAALVLGIPLAILGMGLSAYLYVRLALAAPALVLEKAGIIAALRRSSVLVKGSWWRVFGVLLLASVIAAVISGIIGLPISLVALLTTGGRSASTSYLVAQQIGAGIASVLVAPFSAGVRALLYVDRRMRAEGLDLALQAAVVGTTA